MYKKELNHHLQKGKEWNEDRIIKSSGPRVGNVP